MPAAGTEEETEESPSPNETTGIEEETEESPSPNETEEDKTAGRLV
jgi:hypothetical protein